MQNLTLDRDILHDALYRCTAAGKLCAWATTLDTAPIDSIGVKGKGELALPVDIQQLNELVGDRSKTHSSEEPVFIDKMDIYDAQSSESLLKTVLTELAVMAVQQTFNSASFSLNVDAVLDKLVICSNNQAYCEEFNAEKEPGTFGCMLLQVPVRGITGGACVRVRYGGQSIIQQFDEYCQSKFYLSVLAGRRKAAGRQDYTIVPANKSPCVMLVARLVWLDSASSLPRVDPDRLPQIIESVELVNRALAGWRHLCHEIKKRHLPSIPSQAGSKGAHWVNTSAANPTGYFIPKNEFTNVPLLDASQTRALCLPLTRDYFLKNYTMSSLIGEDALIGRVLNSVSYINLELLLIQSKSRFGWRKTALKDKKLSLPVFKRIPQEGALLREPREISLNTKENLVGNWRGKIFCPHHEKLPPQAKKCSQCWRDKRKPMYVALLIQPKGVHVQNDKEKYIELHLDDLLCRTSRIKEHRHVGGICQEISAIMKDLSDCEAFQSKVIGIVTTLLDVRGRESWQMIVEKLAIETDISRTFHTLLKLAVELRNSNRVEDAKHMVIILADVFFKSPKPDDWKNVVPFFKETIATLIAITPSNQNVLTLAERVLDKFPDAALATVLESCKCAETFYKFLSKILVKKTLNGFAAANSNHRLSTSLKASPEGSNKALYNQLVPKENRIALFTYLATCSSVVANGAVNAIVENMADEINVDLDSLTDAFSFFLSIESIESIESFGSDTRIKHFFSSVAQGHLETLCRLPSKLLACEIVSKTSCGTFKTYRALMETLVIDQLRNVVKLSGCLVKEVVECLFWLNYEPLNLQFIQGLALLGDDSFKCFESSRLHNFVASLLGREKMELEENIATAFVNLWMKHLTRSASPISLDSSLLTKVFNFCFPTNLSHRHVSLSSLLVELIDKVGLDCLVDFLIQVQRERMTDFESITNDGLSFLSVLYKACQKLVKEPNYLASLANHKWMAIFRVVKTVFALGDENMVADLARPILSNQELNRWNPVVYDELVECCSALERVLVLKGQEERGVERDSFWSVTSAVVPNNEKLEAFLRSDLRRQVFGRCDTRDGATAVGNRLVGTSPSPVAFEVKPVGMSYVCELVKEHSFSSSSKPAEYVYPTDLITHRAPSPFIPAPFSAVANVMETWRIEDAAVPNNAQLQTFLRSDLQSRLFPVLPFLDFKKAQSFCHILVKQSPWPIRTHVKQFDSGYLCEVTKACTRKVALHPGYPPYFFNSLNPQFPGHSPPRQPVASCFHGNNARKRGAYNDIYALSARSPKRARPV